MRFAFLILFLSGCANKPLDRWVGEQERTSWVLLQRNISPVEPKVKGGPTPRRGIVVAALHKKDPDYYFHWVRDSANVMRVFVEYTHAKGGDPHARMRDFLELSRDLQKLDMGEPRFNVDGSVDKLPWSRPQYDGPALRALAVIRYLELSEPPADLRVLALSVLRRDLDFIRRVHDRRGFDIWEELYAENYHARLVQWSALERGERFFAGAGKSSPAMDFLARALDAHWDTAKGYYRSQLTIERTDGYTKKNTDLDSAVLVAVMESDRWAGRHSVRDPRLHATVQKLERLFRESYPINRDESLGLAYGRYRGDVYYGGNPWFLITAYYAQFYSRLALAFAQEDVPVTPENVAFIRTLLPDAPAGDAKLRAGTEAHRQFVAACVNKADRIFARLRAVAPADGQLFEQIDKSSGKPVSSRGIGWAHSAFLAAALERECVAREIPTAQLPRD